MSIPGGPIPVPDRVRELADGAALTPVWENGIGGLTFRAEDTQGVRYIKWGPRNPETSAEGEAARLRWAAPFVTVPRVIGVGGDHAEEWLITVGIAGETAVAPRWTEDAATAVAALGEGLRSLHDRLPVEDCPFSWSVADRIANAARRGIRVPDRLQEPPPIDRLVVCHGDACSPNTLLGEGGRVAGHVDLTSLGVADRWADIAVAAMSAGWNFGPGWTETLLDAYGIAPDAERMTYYRELWNAT